MGKQLGLGLLDSNDAKLDPITVPKQKVHASEPFAEYPKGKQLEPRDMVTLIHRCGRTKRVMFSRVIGPRAHMAWPIANEPIEVSLRTGRVVVPRAMGEWRLEPNALEMARVDRDFARLQRKIAVE